MQTDQRQERKISQSNKSNVSNKSNKTKMSNKSNKSNSLLRKWINVVWNKRQKPKLTWLCIRLHTVLNRNQNYFCYHILNQGHEWQLCKRCKGTTFDKFYITNSRGEILNISLDVKCAPDIFSWNIVTDVTHCGHRKMADTLLIQC